MASLTSFDPDNYTAINGNSETVGAVAEPVNTVDPTDLSDIEIDVMAVNQAMEDLDTVVQIRGVMQNAENGIDPDAAEIAEIYIGRLSEDIGYTPEQNIIVGTEHFADFGTRLNATQVGVESLGTWFAEVWAAIVRTCKMILNRLLGVIQSIWSDADNRRRTNFYHANKSQVDAAHAAESKGKPEPMKITDPRIIELFRMEGRPVNKESVMEVASNMELFAESLEELGKNFEPYLGSMEDFLIEYVDVIEALANGKGNGIETVSEKYETTLKKAALVLEALYKKSFEPATTVRLPSELENQLRHKPDSLVSRPLAGCKMVYFTKMRNEGNGIDRYKVNLYEDRPAASEYEDSNLYTFSAGELEILQERIKKINQAMENLGDLIHRKHTQKIKAVMSQLNDVPKLTKYMQGDMENEEYVINLTKLLGQTMQDMIQDYANLFVQGGALLSAFEKGFEIFFTTSIRNILQNSNK